MTKEKMIERIMKECADEGMPVTREEAEQMVEMEMGAKEVDTRGSAEVKAERKPKPRKVDEVKKDILEHLRIVIEGMQLVEGQPAETFIKTETELTFAYKGEIYTLKLTKHRQKKGSE